MNLTHNLGLEEHIGVTAGHPQPVPDVLRRLGLHHGTPSLA